MNIDKVILILRDAIEENNWEIIRELIEDLLYEKDDPYEDYRNDKDLEDEDSWG
ncbi:hypothetical protein H8D04_01430 [bacterium]|nr:hypothetical protein [bacterium]